MLTRWLMFAVFLVSSADPHRAAVTVAPTCRVKGHPEAELTLYCGDRKRAGLVQYWHTPFGDLQTPGLHSQQDPVFMQRDGSLVVPNASILHSGVYYCLLQHPDAAMLWSYRLHVGSDDPDDPDEQRDAFRFRREAGSVEERQADGPDEQLAGAVAASVLLTFMVGFSAGALSRTQVLRCLGAVTSRLRSPRQRRRHGSEVTMTTVPPMYDNQAFEMEAARDDDGDSAAGGSVATTISSITTPPPAKPQRSFRQKRQEEQETTAYLEGCDHMKEEEEEENKGCDGEEEREFSGFYLLGEDGGSQTDTEEEKSSEDGEEEDRRESREENEQRQEEEEEAGEQDRGSEEEKGRNEEREEEVDDGEKRREEDGETGSNKQEDTMKNGVLEGETSPSPARRRRVIRLYQYDEDGHRYGHLPDPAPDEGGPAPRLKQRSLSLTRLNAIMAAASAGPLDAGGTGREEREERQHFHMEL